ncbi:glycosyltransferase [Aquirufa antheringensis]|uniref:glycosyltransferase n=1 Tax=Aquirufa antheringensis TaxID=2516559 RepID=UPI003BAFC345
MKLSVSMITFQGAAYLKVQMDSILGQSIPVQEIIVCDDGSTDGTREILASYAAEYPQIQLYFNEKNLGTVANMQQCLRRTTGDIIFLADQDDVWLPTKVEKMLAFFQENPEADAVFSNADIIDEVGETQYGMTLWDIIGFPYGQVELTDFERRVDNVVTGAGLAFKRNPELLEKDIPQIPGLLHDGWIGLYFAAKNTLKSNPEKLFQYRSHANQQVGGKIKERSQLLNFNLALYDGVPVMKDYATWKAAMKRLYTNLDLPYMDKAEIQDQIDLYAEYGKTYFQLRASLFLFVKAIR